VNYIERLVEQIRAGTARGHKMYIAISDGIHPSSREELFNILKRNNIERDQVIYMSESDILATGQTLRAHMGIPQPGSSGARTSKRGENEQ
jgi:hypothetical protein